MPRPSTTLDAGVMRRGGRKRADVGALPCTMCPLGTAPMAVSRCAVAKRVPGPLMVESAASGGAWRLQHTTASSG
eukprot:scaffold146333_cov27-Tisochrysis_lutea.AAC.2